MKKLSVKTKYALVLVAILVLLVGLQLIFNQVFMERFYLNSKLKRITEIRALVLDYIRQDGSGSPEEDCGMKLRTSCEAAGVDAMILKADGYFGVILFSNASDQDGGAARLFDIVRGRREQEELKVYAEGTDYRIYLTRDSYTGTEQIDCLGYVGSASADSAAGNEYYYVLTVAVAQIAETAEIYSRYVIRIGLFTVLIGSVTMYLVSGSLTKPIKQMTSLSRKMANLDFSERYAGSGGDEIHTLGVNMNEMSTKLEAAIENLKTANARLAEDIAEKDEIDRQRKELLSNISHELKTPIAVIQGYAEGLKDGISEDAAMRDRYCTVIMDEAEKMNRMVRQLLALDELESRGMAVGKECFDLADMLRGEADSFLLRSRKENIRLETEVPEHLFIESDDYLWEQVIQNYLSNAFQYVSPEGTVRIRGEACGTDGVRVSVFNTGNAIPEAELDKIWNKFYKVDKARTRIYGGSGIGLSIVQASMDNLGGSCSVRNLENGVEFIAELEHCLSKRNAQ